MASAAPNTTAAKPKSFKEQWEAMAPPTRRKVAMMGGIGVVLAIAFVVVSGGSTTGGQRNAKGRIENALMVPDGSRELGAAGVANDIKDLSRRVRESEGENARLKAMIERRQNGEDGAASTEARLQSELSELRRVVGELQKNGVAGQGASGRPVVPPGTPLFPNGQRQPPNAPLQPAVGPGPGPVGTATGPETQVAPAPPVAYGGIRTIKPEEPQMVATSNAPPKREEPQLYLPSGTMISGVLLTGVDAPTGQSAMKDPVPVLARIKHDAILPNRFRSDVKECFALLEATGDMPSERAKMRLTNISCVRRDRAVIDVPITGYAVGEDGREGLRGRFVSKQGQALAKATAAGIAEGISQAFGGQNQNLFQPSSGDVNYGSVPEAGAIGGASSALDRVAAYYLELADQLHPIVEIDSGRRITIVLLKGRQLAAPASEGENSPQPRISAR